MAAETQYIVIEYDNEASGPFVAGATPLTWSGGSGHIITVVDDGTTGKLAVALISGVRPTNNQQLTQGSTTADTNGPAPNGDSEFMLYPAYAREDLAVAVSGDVTWTGPALGATHSFFFDGQTVNVSVGEILTFADGQQCEVITVVSDAGASGELNVRMITNLDTFQFPDDNDTFTGSGGGNGTLNGVVHPRAYNPLNLHRLLQDLADDRNIAFGGDDVLSIIDPTPSDRSTDQIISLLGNVNINDTVAQHMFGGSVSQASGFTLYSGVDIQITDADGSSIPVVIQNDAIVTGYWDNAYMPDSIAGRVRIMRKTREDGVDIDGKRIKAKLLEFGDTYFEGATTLGTASTALALFSSPDGNNQTAEGTVAGAPYNTTSYVEGYQTIDLNNGAGARPYYLKKDFGSATSAQSYEYDKYTQRRGTSETFFSRNAQLFTGLTLNFPYTGEAGGPFVEGEVVAWGTEIPYTGESGAGFSVGEVVVGGTSGARGRILYLDDNGTTGTIIVAQDSGATPFSNTETITGQTSATTATTGTVVTNSNAGTMVLYALDDTGTTGNLYGQRTRGVAPSNTQTVYGATSAATADVNGTAQTRVINNQFIGSYTGSAYNPANFGIVIDPSDATAADLFTDLLGATQQPPNNQVGLVTGVAIGDSLAVYPYDGASLDINGDPEPDFDEMQLATALTAGVSTIVDVGTGNIPVNTPATGFLRIQRDSDGQYDLVPYASHDGDGEFTLVGTAPSAASISNNVFRAFIDKVTTSTSESYTAVQTGTNQVTIINRRGGVNPIKTFKGTATFGTAGFTAAVQRISDA